MFPEVHSVLKLDQRKSLDGLTVSILEDGESLCGSFLIHHFLAHSLKSEGNVVFLGLEQSLGHYHAIAMKLGVNLVKAKRAEKLVFIEGLKSVAEAYAGEEQNEFSFVSHPEMEDPLKALYMTIRASVEKLSGGSTTLIVDKLSLLSTLGVSTRDITVFAKYLQQLCTEFPRLCLVTLFRPEDESGRLSAYLTASSSLSVETWPLKTGRSANVSGNLRFEWRESAETGRFQFSVGEKDVKVFALGASKSVL